MSDRPNDTKSMALFCDFENVALGVRESKYQQFDISKVLERLLLKGSIVVKKAYCDWERYREFKAAMHQASFELIEIPHVRMSGKNSADIRMVVDALDLCYTKSHVDTFVIISGDSDFSPLVSKLRENAKTVIGVGVKNSTSELLINNCDEFIYYDDLVRAARPARRRPSERPLRPGAGPDTGRPGAHGEASRFAGRAESSRGASGIDHGRAAPISESGRGAVQGESASTPSRVSALVIQAAQADRSGPWETSDRLEPADRADRAEQVEQATRTEQTGRAGRTEDAAQAEPHAQAEQAGHEEPPAAAVKPARSTTRSRRGAAARALAAEADAASLSATVAAAAGEQAAPVSDAGTPELGATVEASASPEEVAPERAPRRRRSTRKTAESAAQVPADTQDPAHTALPAPASVPAPAPEVYEAAPSSGRSQPAGSSAHGSAEPSSDEGRDAQAFDRMQQALDLVVGTIEALAAERDDDDKIWGSMVKQTLKRRRPGFNENYYGFRSFNRLLEEARDRGLIELNLDDKSGGYTVRSLG